jgi:4-hydroxy-2-oxoglutarate aldolase
MASQVETRHSDDQQTRLKTLSSKTTQPDIVYSQPKYSESFSSTSVDMAPEQSKRPLKPGVYVPTLAFFEPESEDLDLNAVARHTVRLVKAGVVGIVTQGSNGEAVHLTHNDRQLITKTTRKALDDAGFPIVPIMVGCGAQSTRETIELCQQAQAAGGDYALVLPPSYYKPSCTEAVLLDYFRDVATASPIPILIYNYPGAVAGIDLDSDVIIELSKHPNIIGCKLTCGNNGKLTRIASSVQTATPSNPTGFMCMGGSADFTLQALIGGGSGSIVGLGNVCPASCVRVFDLYAEGKIAEAQKLQAIVARGDWAAIAGGVVGTKSGLQSYFGYGGYARRPLPRPSKAEVSQFEEQFKEIVELEKKL